jgi:hypothetical protein
VLLEGKASSVGELVNEVKRLSKEFNPDYRTPEEFWFRGQARRSQPLIPSLYREDLEKFHYDEGALVDRFKQLATPLVSPRPESEWEWYFLARHHGLPSRLLDWSEALLPALYFALAPHFPSDRLMLDDQLQIAIPPPCHNENSPTVWMLDAGSLNQVSISVDAVVVPGGPKSAPYLPDAISEKQMPTNALPIAILPPHASVRISAQKGTFTIHGWERTSLEVIALHRHDVKLAGIVLDRSRLAQLCEELYIIGTTRLNLFPDLDSVVGYVTWICQSVL